MIDPPVALVTVSFSKFGKYRSGNVPSYAILYFARAAICKASGENVESKKLRKTWVRNVIPWFPKLNSNSNNFIQCRIHG